MMSKGYKAVAYNELCRLCAQITTKRMDIFSDEGRMREIAKSIQQLLCINVSEVDPLPKTICSFCLNRVEDFKEFHANCLNASQFLHLKLPSVEKASGKCYVSINAPVRPACLKRKISRHLKAPIETTNSSSAKTDLQLDQIASNINHDEEEVEVREYEECVQQPDSADNNYSNDILKLFEDTVDTDYFIQDHDYMSIDPSIRELLGQETPKKLPPTGKNLGKVMPIQDHDYLSSYENPMTPNVAHQELLDHNYFTSLGPFADNFVNLLTPEEEGKFIEHNYFLPSNSPNIVPPSFEAEKPLENQEECKEQEMLNVAEEEQCELCGQVFVLFEGHDCSADYQRQCESCGDIFMTNENFVNHPCSTSDLEKCLEQEDVQCEECGAIFPVKNHHNCLADFDRQCHKCGLVFSTIRLFEDHHCFVGKIKTCHFCGSKFKLKGRLKHHIIRCHLKIQEMGKGPFTCNICDASYRRRAFYMQHIQSHKKLESVKASYQSKIKKQSKLKLNFEISSEPTKVEYRCSQCLRNFCSNSSLAIHRRLHSKPYTKFTCEVCNSNFLKQTDYCKHVSSHLEVHKFPCDECPKGFESQKELQNHKIRHNANRKIRSALKARKQNYQ